VKFTLPDQLPATRAELDELATKARAEIGVFLARREAGQADEFTADDIERVQYLNSAIKTLAAEDTRLAEAEKPPVDVNALLDEAAAAAKPAPAAPAAPETPAEAPAEEAAEVVAEAEKITEDAAAPAAVTAGAPGGGKSPFAGLPNNALPGGTQTLGTEKPKRWGLLPSAPKYSEFGGALVDSRTLAESIESVRPGQRTGRQKTGEKLRAGTMYATQALAKIERPHGEVIETAEQFFEAIERASTQIPGRGKVNAQALTAAGGWCAPSEQLYDFCPTPAAGNLISLPEIMIKRGGISFPAEPDFSELQTGFHFTEAQLEAVDGEGEPTAIKEFVEIPCPDTMVEYRLEAIGWAVKAGILQRQAWPELIEKFVDEFLVEHQYRVSAKTILKMIAASSAAKVIPTDAILGTTTSILNGLHVQARNLQIKTRKETVEGVAPIWFRDVLRADLATRDGKDMLSVTDAEIDNWLAIRGIYLQYEGRWQSLTSGKPGNLDTLWWPDSVDVMLYPAGTFFRSLDNVITFGVEYPMDQLQKNRYTHGFLEDSFLVGKRCDPSNLVRVPLCTNGAVGAREEITCSYTGVATLTATITTTGTPTGGTFKLKFTENERESGTIAFDASANTLKTTVAAIDDNAVAADFSATGGALPTAVVLTYPAYLGELELGTNSLTGGTTPSVSISIA
jgi:hypothetical protein